MSEFLQRLAEQMRSLWQGMDPRQKTISSLLVFGTLGCLIWVAAWAGRPEYEMLYSGLDQTTAAQVVEKLRDQKVPYKLAGGGSVIFVPAGARDELRLSMAGEGIEGSVLGYELLDRSSLGVTDRQQELNIKRATEGELSKSIQSLEAVIWARVHIAQPEESFYASSEKEPRASVLVKLRPGTQLVAREVAAIRCLVSSAVEGMRPGGVTITDTEMRMLARASDGQEAGDISSSHLELQQSTEKYLTEKVESMLMNVLGPGHSIVRVSAELQTEQAEVTLEKFDPESKVLRSEERTEESSTSPQAAATGAAAPAAAAGQQRKESTTTNYEINRTTETRVDRGGSIQRLSVAVVVDGTYEETEAEDGTMERAFVPRSAEEIADFTTLVKQAVGFDAERGDEVSVVSAPFDTTAAERVETEMAQAAKKEMFVWVGRRALTFVGVAVGLLMLRSRLKKISTGAGPGGASVQVKQGEIMPEQAESTQQRAERLVRRSPDEVADLLRVWMSEG